MANEHKIHEVEAVGEAPPTGGRGGGWGKRGGLYLEERKAGADLRGDMGLLGFWDPCRLCLFGVFIFDTYTSSNDGRHPQKNCLRTSGTKRVIILRLALSDNATS